MPRRSDWGWKWHRAKPCTRQRTRDRRSGNIRGQLRVPRRDRAEWRPEREATHSMINQIFTVAAGVALFSVSVGAQVTPRATALPLRADTATAATAGRAGCPGGNGIHISATSGTLTDSSSGVNRVIGLNQSVDTTLVFDISRKTWTRTNIA